MPAPTKELDRKLHQLLSRHAAGVSGRVWMIDLEAFRTHLGSEWVRMGDKVLAIARQSIERHLGPADMVAPYGDTAFLVVFGQSSAREAELKCLLVAREAGRRLAGNDAAASMVDVRSAIVGHRAALTFEEPGSEEAPQPAAAAQPSIEALLLLPPLMTTGMPHWGQIEFIYRPLLSLRGMVVSTFVCVPTRKMPGRGYVSGYQVLPDQSDIHGIVDLDMVVLAKVASDLRGMAERNVKALLSLPVHVETMAVLRHRTAYIQFCREHLSMLADRIIFELVELPEGIPQSRLFDLVSTLRPFSRAVIARFPLERRSFASFHLAGLHAVGADIYYSSDREDALMAKMDSFVERAARESLRTYVHGLRSISLTTAAIATGFDYIDGYSLSSVVDIPQKPLRFDLRQLYEPRLVGRQPAETPHSSTGGTPG